MARKTPPKSPFSKSDKPVPRMSGSKPDGPKRGRRSAPAEKEDATRMLHKKVKTARGRKISSKLWIERQINDPYVQKAKAMGYRSRAAFKLEELDDKFHLIKKGARVVDLGCAPGGWLQVAVKRGAGHIVGIDLIAIEGVADAKILEMDFMDPAAPATINALMDGRPDLVMSDLAANTTGHRQTDHLKTVSLVEAAAYFAMENLAMGGDFVTKVFQGGTQNDMLNLLKQHFEKTVHAKPDSSRKGSPEIYLVAKNLRSRPKITP